MTTRAQPPPAFIVSKWITMKKYWFKRYVLFSKFDLGCRLDEESFFSVSPEWLAKLTADRLPVGTTVLDPFCGAGGNVIQFAMAGKKGKQQFLFEIDELVKN